MGNTVAFSGYRPEKLLENIDPIQIALKNTIKECINMNNFYSLYSLYSDIVDKISILNAKEITENINMTGDEARELTAKVQELDFKITTLKSRIKKLNLTKKSK